MVPKRAHLSYLSVAHTPDPGPCPPRPPPLNLPPTLGRMRRLLRALVRTEARPGPSSSATQSTRGSGERAQGAGPIRLGLRPPARASRTDAAGGLQEGRAGGGGRRTRRPGGQGHGLAAASRKGLAGPGRNFTAGAGNRGAPSGTPAPSREAEVRVAGLEGGLANPAPDPRTPADLSGLLWLLAWRGRATSAGRPTSKGGQVPKPRLDGQGGLRGRGHRSSYSRRRGLWSEPAAPRPTPGRCPLRFPRRAPCGAPHPPTGK